MYPSPADTRRNAFTIDGLVTPQARSPLAILDVERDELDLLGVQAALARARTRRQQRPEEATVYGRTVSLPELDAAAEQLADPRRRLLAELLDPWPHEARVEPAELAGLDATIRARAADLGGAAAVTPRSAALVIDLVLETLGPPPRLDPDARPPAPPVLDLADLLAGA